MRCFVGVFRRCRWGRGGWCDAGGTGCPLRTEFRSLRDAFLRHADADILIARASKAPRGVVVGFRLARNLEARESP